MGSGSAGRRSKVAQLIDRYGLEGVGADLESSWIGDGQERASLRDLADKFNRALLVSSIQEAGMDVIDGEPENFYRLLTDDNVSSGQRVEARNRLERGGVDVDQIESDFVSYQAIRHYLTEVRGVSYESDESKPVEAEQDTIGRLKSRIETIVRDTVDRLKKRGRVAVGEYRVFVSIDVLCQDCNRRYSVTDLLREGSCDCESTIDSRS